ncbi:MAG: LysM peptidoglycan-binding domain-containing protein [Bacteroidales bacterium]|nr:LysM peptidoglycan-binding domain-containing protein [Bacteroidales bacterium]MBN2763728.1 LysM peptidoglycan-binding domain-containing protein [Bacteroidales bacterium]
MNTINRYLTVCTVLFFAVTMTSAQFQPAEVIKSNQKVLIQGRYYIIHTVQKGQTFFSICKAYGVNREIVLKENPGIDPATLSEGQAIRIPDYSHVIIPSSPKEVKQHDKRFYYHTVKPGQTVYFLSKKYDVPEEWIYQFNPGARESLTAGQVVIIPKRKEFESILAVQDTAEYRYYTVREKDTLYSLCQQYGVSINRIIEENPVLQEGLKAGTVIRIPRIAPDSLLQPVDSTAYLEAEPLCDTLMSGKKDFKIALLLPFFASLKTDEPIMTEGQMSGEIPENPALRQQELIGRSFIEFYEGFLLALDTLRSKGLSLKLYVWDTERDTVKISKIIQELYNVQPDLIIGPVYSKDVKMVGRFAMNQGINLVSPLSTRDDLISDNPNVIQVVPSDDDENEFFARYIAQFKDNPIILFRDDDSLSMRSSWKLKTALLSHLDTDSMGNPLNFRDYRINDSTMRKLSSILQSDAENIIIIASENEPDVTALIARLHLMSRVYKISLYGVPAWQVWKSIDINYFHAMELKYYTPFYIDYNNPEVIRFIKKCRKIYGFEPYENTSKGYNFCMLGYDIGVYFISALALYGSDFAPCMNNINLDLLLTQYNFSRCEGGYANRSIHMITYKPDFTIEKIPVPETLETESDEGIEQDDPDQGNDDNPEITNEVPYRSF